MGPVASIALDDLSLEAALLAEAPSAGNSRAVERWAMLRQLLGAADLAGGICVGMVLGVALGVGGLALLAFAAGTGAGWTLLCFSVGLSARESLRCWASGVPDAGRLCAAALMASWPLAGAVALAGAGSWLAAAAGAAALAAVSGGLRAVARGFVHRLSPLRQRTLIVGSGQVAGQVAAAIAGHVEAGLDAIGLVDDEPHAVGDVHLPWLGGIGELPRVLGEHAVDRVVIAFSRAGHDELLGCLRVCRDAGVAVDVVPRLFELLDAVDGLDHVGTVPLLSIRMPRLGRGSRAAKRALDVTIAGIALLVLSPLVLAISAAIKLTSRGPVIFRQPRAGQGGRAFDVWKFRSMYVDAEERKAELAGANEHGDGLMFKLRRDPRITRVGGFLRRASLDELPQLVNVLRGEMSLVGPRPIIFGEARHLVEDWHLRRLDLRPGITGLWQVSGRSDIAFGDMVRLDYQYVSGWSPARDLELLLATLPAVLARRGAY